MTKQKEEPAAVWLETSKLVPWDKNPRQNENAVDKVAASIKRFGFGAPIVARKADNFVIAGHTRLKAAQKLGLERVPVRLLDLDPADARLLNLNDNRTAEEAEWDYPLLAEILREYSVEDRAASGFDLRELELLLAAAWQPPTAEPGNPFAQCGTTSADPVRAAGSELAQRSMVHLSSLDAYLRAKTDAQRDEVAGMLNESRDGLAKAVERWHEATGTERAKDAA